MITVDATNRIILDGARTNLAVTQNAGGTVVYTPESLLGKQAYKAHSMPHKRYSLAHDDPASGVPGRSVFEANIRSLIATQTRVPTQGDTSAGFRTKSENDSIQSQSQPVRSAHRP